MLPMSPMRVPSIAWPPEMVKTPDELALMRISGKLLASVFSMLDKQHFAGMSTLEVNDLVEHFITTELAARPASKGQYGFKFVLNCSINHVVCHGVPDPGAIIRGGDIINLDITLEKNGFIADSSKTYLVGNVAPAAKRLVQIAQEAMWKGIEQVRPGAHLGDIGFAIERHAKKNGYSVVREYCGHGIGREMHEDPQVLNYGRRGTGLKLLEGMVFTIEPMVNQGTRKVTTERDGWTVVTNDRKLSAQFEHTVAVTREGVEVLTLRPDEAPKLERGA
jgi:methionyl aminopeptidase